jgi:hypothetical protein
MLPVMPSWVGFLGLCLFIVANRNAIILRISYRLSTDLKLCISCPMSNLVMHSTHNGFLCIQSALPLWIRFPQNLLLEEIRTDPENVRFQKSENPKLSALNVSQSATLVRYLAKPKLIILHPHLFAGRLFRHGAR